MAVLFGSHPIFADHDSGTHHPERSERLKAVARGMEAVSDVVELLRYTPGPAPMEALVRVHDSEYLESLKRFCLMGGGELDPDTAVSIQSWDAAVVAAGAGLDAADRLRAGEADSAFVAVRPPGHHAVSGSAMGFCLINNVAVLAADLSQRGEKVLILDFDAHHGNGTQDIFIEDPSVLYVSTHQFPLFPGSGRVQEVGSGVGFGMTVNIPLPERTTGPTLRYALDQIARPTIEGFGPTWLLMSAGFDAHYRDPLTEMGLSSGDFGQIVRWAMEFVPKQRSIAMLEGGYDLSALRDSTSALLSALEGQKFAPEEPGTDKPEFDLVNAMAEVRFRALGVHGDGTSR
ncbi:MAG: histone deacetylase [Acidimicrobiaceae bacterium]|nr:histone deacetylase [Acidimicrobiaceae bacterium]